MKRRASGEYFRQWRVRTLRRVLEDHLVITKDFLDTKQGPLITSFTVITWDIMLCSVPVLAREPSIDEFRDLSQGQNSNFDGLTEATSALASRFPQIRPNGVILEA